MVERAKNSFMVLVWLLIASLAILALLRECSPEPKPIYSKLHDTVTVPAPYPVYITKDSIKTVVRYIPSTISKRAANNNNNNTTTTQLLLAIDSLQKELIAKSGATVELQLDTVTNHGDTVNIRANEALKRIDFAMRYAPKKIAVERIKETITVTQKPTISVGVGVGYGVTPLLQFTPVLSANIQYSILSF